MRGCEIQSFAIVWGEKALERRKPKEAAALQIESNILLQSDEFFCGIKP